VYQLYQGDCLEVMKNIPDKSIDMILCDLPYGITARNKWDTILPLDTLWEQYNRVIKNNGAIVLFGSEPFSSMCRTSNIKQYKYDWVWDKKQAGNVLNAKRQPLKIFENIMVFNTKTYYPIMRKGKLRKKGGLNKQPEITGKVKLDYTTYNDKYYPTAILEFSNANKRNRLHPTQKPVALLEYLIKTYTNKGEVVLDNCMGSGSTGIACLNTNRNFIGIELDEGYFKIAEQRLKECGCVE
jgi:site-specific DNA-methyltransferase (adenine-specific)